MKKILIMFVFLTGCNASNNKVAYLTSAPGILGSAQYLCQNKVIIDGSIKLSKCKDVIMDTEVESISGYITVTEIKIITETTKND